MKKYTKWNTKLFKEKMYEINPNIQIMSDYITYNTKLLCICNICHYEWYAKPGNLILGKGCQICAGNMRKTTGQFVQELKEVNNDVTVLGEYINNKTKILCKCNICNETFMMLPRVLLRGCIHKKCADDNFSKKRMKSQDAFILDLSNINKNIELMDEYRGNSKKVTCRCKICDYIWTPFANNLMKGQGCPHCNISKGEKRIEEYLNSSNIDFIPQMKYDGLLGVNDGLLSYDFYLPTYNLLIEYQGQYHDGTAGNQTEEQFKIQQEHDKRKRDYALANNIKLLEIWYMDFDNIEEILHKELDKSDSYFII